MTISAGDSGCTFGLSGDLYTAITGDSAVGLSSPLLTAQANGLKAWCYENALAIAARVNTTAMHVTDGSGNTGDVGTLLFSGSGVTVSIDATSHTATITVSGGGGSYTAGTGITISGTVISANTSVLATQTYVGTAIAAVTAASIGALAAANNLSDVASAATARTNLGLGTAATSAASAFDPAGAAAAVTTTSIGAVPTSRQVASGSGLTGGGDLTADRTLAVSFSGTAPNAVGTGSAGSASTVSRSDHVHPAVIPPPAWIPLAGGWSVDATMATSALYVVGGTPDAPLASEYAVTGRTAAFTLKVTALATTGQTGYVDLFDVTTGLSVIGGPIAITGSATPAVYSATATLNGSAHIYRLQAGCTGTTAAHYLAGLGAGIKVTWS